MKGLTKLAFAGIFAFFLGVLAVLIYNNPVFANDTPVGIERNGTVFHLWNNKDDYYIDDGGFQLTNHFQKFWTNNTVCVGAATPSIELCGNSVPWTWANSTDNETFVNLTGTFEISVGQRKAKIELEYYLRKDDIEIQITPKATGTGNQPVNGLYLKINMHDIRINMSTDSNTIYFDTLNSMEREFSLQGLNLKVNETNFTSGGFWYELWRRQDNQYLRFRGEDFFQQNNQFIEVKPQIAISPQVGWNNSQVNLTIPFGNVNSGDSLSYTFYWIDALGFGGNDVAFYYAVGIGNSQFRIWNISSNSVSIEQTTNDTALGNVITLQACDIPNQNKTIIISADSLEDAMVQIHNGTPQGNFGNNITVTTNLNIAGARAKPIACAVEELSKKAIAVYADAVPTTLDNVTIWNGTTHEKKNIAADPDRDTQTKQHWLTARKGSNEIAWWGDTVFNQTFVALWNSSSNEFYDMINLTARNEGAVDRIEGFTKNKTSSCSFETVSGQLVCFYGNYSRIDGSLYVFIRNATEQAVNPQAKETLIFNITTANISKIVFVNSIANPTSDEILVLVGGNHNATAANLSIFIWNGTNLTNFLQIENNTIATQGGSSTQDATYMHGDAVYHYFSDNRTDTEALFCWINEPDNAIPNCRVWNGTTYSDERNAIDASNGATDIVGVILTTSINNNVGLSGYWAFLATIDEGNDLNIQNFNGSAWGNLNELEIGLAFRLSITNVWTRYDNTTPVFRSVGTNETDNAINASSTINLNATIRDNFQLDCWWIETNETGVFTNYTDGTRINCTQPVKSSYWQYGNITWQNNSITVATGGVAYNFCANDTNSNRICSDRRTFLIAAAGGAVSTLFSLKANHTSDSTNVSITTSTTTLVTGNAETNDTVTALSIILQNSTNNVTWTNITTDTNYPRANVSSYSISSLNGNSTQFLFNVSSNTAGTFYLRIQVINQSSGVTPMNANSTTSDNDNTSIILNVTTAIAANTCTPTNNAQWDLLCSDNCSVNSINVNVTNWIINNSGTINFSNVNISYQNLTWNAPIGDTCILNKAMESTFTRRSGNP